MARAKSSKKKATKKKATGKAVARRKEPAKSVGKLIDYGDDADAGFEGVTRDDFAIPFLGILHQMSPQCNKQDGAYIEGAEAGMIFNTVTGELWEGDEGVVVVPCHRAQHFIEWIPRDAGGGLVNVWDPTDPFVVDAREGKSRFQKIELKSGNDLVETFSMFALVVKEDGSYDQVIITFTSSRVKNYKQWMTRASSILVKQPDGRNVRPPMWAHRYRLTTRAQSNDKGHWHDWLISYDGADADEARLDPESELYMAGRAFRNLAMEEAKTAIAKQEQEAIQEVEYEDADAL